MRTRESKKGDPHKDAADKYERQIKKREKSAKLSKKTPTKHHYADSAFLANVKREMVVNSDIARKCNES